MRERRPSKKLDAPEPSHPLASLVEFLFDFFIFSSSFLVLFVPGGPDALVDGAGPPFSVNGADGEHGPCFPRELPLSSSEASRFFLSPVKLSALLSLR